MAGHSWFEVKCAWNKTLSVITLLQTYNKGTAYVYCMAHTTYNSVLSFKIK